VDERPLAAFLRPDAAGDLDRAGEDFTPGEELMDFLR